MPGTSPQINEGLTPVMGCTGAMHPSYAHWPHATTLAACTAVGVGGEHTAATTLRTQGTVSGNSCFFRTEKGVRRRGVSVQSGDTVQKGEGSGFERGVCWGRGRVWKKGSRGRSLPAAVLTCPYNGQRV